MIKTATTIDGVNSVDFGNNEKRYYWIKNIGDTTVHVSTKETIAADADDVGILNSGDITMLENYGSKIYVLGAGKVEIHEQETPTCPFKIIKKGGENSGSNYISNGLIKSISTNEIGSEVIAVSENLSDIVTSEEMTIECCAMYSGFINTTKKGRLFSLGTSNTLIGMSMYNNLLEAAFTTDTFTGWATSDETGITVEPNEFVTLTMTSNSEGTNFYKNGVLYGNYPDNIASTAGTVINKIGINRDYSRNDRDLHGNVYMIRFYNRILSMSELSTNVQADIHNFM